MKFIEIEIKDPEHSEVLLINTNQIARISWSEGLGLTVIDINENDFLEPNFSREKFEELKAKLNS